ncbi:hypothetical protein C8R45DRAFT_828078 [Mycena sanguinolenta]|nr:hypothetical protein C8R45DRAFT_828078 [Mycena sanguinolenta]
MYPAIRSFCVAFLFSASIAANAQQSKYPATPLASKHFAYPSGIPYQADTDPNLIRGWQTGYNLCNSTTEGPNSLCQTSFLCAIDDFCLWAPINPNSTIADTEGEEVAWCTKPGRGTRIFPPGALQGVQFTRTPDYVQVVGFIDQTLVNLRPDDSGGELDPHGADLRGNPLGGLVYSTAWSGDNTTYTQVLEWHNFMGGGQFCFKACDPSGPNAPLFCAHNYDRIGCSYNAPSNAQNGTFESCMGDSQDYPGIYTGTDGIVSTYSQPPESLGVISSMPYDPKVPPSSNCVQYTSAGLYSALGTTTATATATASGAEASMTSTRPGASNSGSQTKSGASAGASQTGTPSGEGSVGVSMMLGALGVALVAVFLA